MPKIVHCKKQLNSYYIGRKQYGNHFGNPFSHKKETFAVVLVESREESISRFRTWLSGESDTEIEQERREWILRHLEILRDKDLGCWCKPLDCHGDVYFELLYKAAD